MHFDAASFVPCAAIGHLVKDGSRRRAPYRLAEKLTQSTTDAERTGKSTPAGSQHNAESSQRKAKSYQHNTVSSQHNVMSSQHNAASSQRNAPVLADAELLAIAALARGKAWLPPSQMKELIRQLCERRSLTVARIAGLLNPYPEGIRNRFLSEMVPEGSLLTIHPDRTRPAQADRTNSAGTVQSLLKTLRQRGHARLVGRTKAGLWFPDLECDSKGD